MFKQYISLASILRPRNSLIATSKLYVVDKARLKKLLLSKYVFPA